MSKNFEKGIKALYAGNLAEAEGLFSKAISDDPLNFEAYFYRGKTRWQQNSYAAAINDFQKVLELNPNHNQAQISIDMIKQILAFRNPDIYNA